MPYKPFGVQFADADIKIFVSIGNLKISKHIRRAYHRMLTYGMLHR